MKNQRGVLTLDFLFSFTLVIGFSGILFAMTLTLTVVEITQYMTYSSARNYMASHNEENERIARAQAKFEKLKQEVYFFSNDWFILDLPNISTNLNYHNDPNDPKQEYLFRGTWVDLEARMLGFKIPFFGSTDPHNQGFRTQVGSYLGKEIDIDECKQFNDRLRWQWIEQKFQGDIPSPSDLSNYTKISDNGC